MIPPFHVGMTWDFTAQKWTPPYTVLDATDRCIAGHIESRDDAERIASALNCFEING